MTTEAAATANHDGDRPQPLATVCELQEQHATEATIEALADKAQLDSEDEDGCMHCHRRTARLFWELEQLEFIDDLMSDAEELKMPDVEGIEEAQT